MLNLKVNKLLVSVIFIVSVFTGAPVYADNVSAYELLYNEQEAGTDVYRVRFLITDHFIRIDDLSDDSGYVLYDDNDKKIYSVSHFDRAVLVISASPYKKPDMKERVKESLVSLESSPKIGGKTVYNFKAVTVSDVDEVCLDIQLVPGLLPGVTKLLQSYKKVVAGQQVKGLASTPEEYQTTCYLYDQIFDDGEYYKKGLPIQEWHSNGRKKILTSYKKKDVSSKLFERSDNYREYSLNQGEEI